MEPPFPSSAAPRTFPCRQCGASLAYQPGTELLKCPYCGYENHIEARQDPIEERDFRAVLAEQEAREDHIEVLTVHCEQCGAETTLDPNVTADTCPFCDTPFVQTAVSQRIVKPQALLPFRVTREEAQAAFRKWIRGLWFAPNDVKRYARREERLAGMYIPHWTYDAVTTTAYTGQRGEYYYVSETYTAIENGKPVTRRRQVRKTRWYPASGVVHNRFDDVLVCASNSLPRKYITALEPWDLEALTPYDDAYLSGFRAESYSVDLEMGFGIAASRMEPVIDATIRQDIGGDTQRILSKRTRYDDITFKHLLLPVWISAYRYRDRVYRFMINARTGEVQGERPWSWVKITLAVLAGLIVAAVVAYLYSQSR